MKKIFTGIFPLFLLTISTLSLNSCSERAETVSCFPNTSVNVVLNLNLPSYLALQSEGGWIYVNEQLSGTRGLIVVRGAGGFKVYDRNAPHLCPDNNTTLNVVENIKVVCAKDNSEWILLTGEPIKVAQIPPKTYPYTYNASSNTLTVYN